MSRESINFADKFAKFSEQWQPKIIAQMNDYHFKLVRLQGEFVWHQHATTDEVFIVLDGELIIHLRDGDVKLRAGEMYVVPRGVEHKPEAARECRLMLVEPAGTPNTGDAGGPRTAEAAWI
ncbi:MAG TPA: cupin domain-containing protein [Methylomirabilota bacterium]|jgi:mannose-6-phosphate isomerase-like protein (cupin superfamily)